MVDCSPASLTIALHCPLAIGHWKALELGSLADERISTCRHHAHKTNKRKNEKRKSLQNTINCWDNTKLRFSPMNVYTWGRNKIGQLGLNGFR